MIINKSIHVVVLFALALGFCVAPAAAQKSSKKKRTKDITFNDIKFKMKKGSKFKKKMITKKIKKMEKTKIRIRGWIHPGSTFKRKGIKRFVLVRDNQECCFGPSAALYDCIIVRMAPGKSATFSTKPISVEGTFNIKPFKVPGVKRPLAIYALTNTKVK